MTEPNKLLDVSGNVSMFAASHSTPLDVHGPIVGAGYLEHKFQICGPNGKLVLWISPDGKIHVDPDAPADETARAVCEILQGTPGLK